MSTTEKLLVKCDNTILADEIVSLLNEQGIASRLHDEQQDQVTGAYGAFTGIAVYVYGKDFDKAKAIIVPIMESRKAILPLCPKCGSEDTQPLVRPKHTTTYNVVIILLLFIPGLYMGWGKDFGLISPIGNITAIALVVAAFIMMIALRHHNDNYKCNQCGKRFNHYDTK